MGLQLPNNNDGTYYVANGNHGEYQYITLEDIIETFLATYVGKDKICENVLSSDVAFHASRAFQELNYDVSRRILSQELVIPPSLSMLLPRDFINYVKFSWSDTAGIKHIIYPANGLTSNPTDVGYDAATDAYSFTANVLDTDETSDTVTNFKTNTPNELTNDFDYNDDYTDLSVGRRYGLEPRLAQVNGTFFIDYKTGKVHFSSNIAGKTVIIEYISDGLGYAGDNTDGDISSGKAVIHKFAEEACYKHILYGCLLARRDTDGGLLSVIKRERFAETRKAKLRLSNIKLEEITQVLRGQSKHIKH